MDLLKFKLAVLGVALFASCQENPHDSSIAAIDKVKIELDSAAQVYSKIDTNGYTAFDKKYKQNVAFVQQKLAAKGDTINRETAMLMADYRELKKPYAQFKTKYEQAGTELEFTDIQLITLRYVLKKNNMDTVISKSTLANEIKATESIISTIDHLNVSNTNVRNKKAEMDPKIDSLITTLKQY